MRCDHDDDRPLLTQLVEELESPAALTVVDLTQPLGPDDAGDRPAADVRAVARRDDRRHLALRRQGAGLVLEHAALRRAHRHALRRAGPLDHRQGSAGQRVRHDSGARASSARRA